MGVYQALSFAVGHIVNAEGNQSPVWCCHMDATALQALQINIPGILESHTRDAQEVALSPIQKTDRSIAVATCSAFNRLAKFPMLPNIIPCVFCSTLPVRVGLCLCEFKLSDRN